MVLRRGLSKDVCRLEASRHRKARKKVNNDEQQSEKVTREEGVLYVIGTHGQPDMPDILRGVGRSDGVRESIETLKRKGLIKRVIEPLDTGRYELTELGRTKWQEIDARVHNITPTN